jgi:penicillin amidase
MLAQVRPIVGWAWAAAVSCLIGVAPAWAEGGPAAIPVDGLGSPVLLSRDSHGVMHITAPDEDSMAFAQGYVHARDRLFQMDLFRRTASGTLAELLGPGAIPDDVELRTVGLRRAAEKTLPVLNAAVREALDAYARGVNAYTSDLDTLPPEYGALGLAAIEDWTPLDSVTIGKFIAFQLSASLDDIDRTEAWLTYRAALGPDRGDALFFEDLWRVAPFEPIATVSGRETATGRPVPEANTAVAGASETTALLSLTRAWQGKLKRAPRMRDVVRAREAGAGSNAFALSGRLSRDRRPLLANDPHLDLTVPSLFYPIQLRAIRQGFDVRGASFAGLPYVVQGVTPFLAWGVTVSGIDVTDVYEEQLVPTPGGGLNTLYQGALEPVQALPQVFRANVGGTLVAVPVPPDQGGVTLIVPRRSDGPIIASLPQGKALSLQWAGSGPTFEIEAFRGLSRAKSRADFEAALKRFDVGSENVLYADRNGTIAYDLSGEVPLREDLQAGSAIVPPFLIRNGQGGQEWIALSSPPPDQALPFAILPATEMPREANPPSGYLVSANNDPLGDTFDNDALNQLRHGGGIRYLGADFNVGLRAKRIDDLLRSKAGGRGLSFREAQTIMADVTMPDASVFVGGEIVRAFDGIDSSSHPALLALANEPGVAEAVERLRVWTGTAPTGVPEGYDAADTNGALGPVSGTEIEESIAASIYSLWRAQMIAKTIDRTLGDRTLGDLPKPRSRYAIRALRHLLQTFDANQGIGASGLDFFTVPGVAADPHTRRDIIVLESLKDALDRLASDDLAAAFANARDQDAYRWGRLHRVAVDHPLGGPFSLTSPDGPFPPPFPGLPGLPVDGGFETVDRASHDVRAGLAGRDDPLNDFLFTTGPVDRFVVSLGGFQNRVENALPGGISGVLGSPFYADLLGPWLTNEPARIPSCSVGCGSLEILVPVGMNPATGAARL